MCEIAPPELSDRLQADGDDVLVIDIRNEDEFHDWHIPGSKNVPIYDELKENPEEAAQILSNVPNEKEIVTVCAAGVLSQKATDSLREMGYGAKTLVDGMNGWSRVHRSAPVDISIDGRLVRSLAPGKDVYRTS